tara:strand:+ start:8757 stop:10568 length:1812 start_codon:yes stop_codon:yes gene_type:complete
MGEVTGLQFTIDGTNVLEPVNWQDLKEVLEYGQNSNQPSIDSESFTFQGDSANLIMNHLQPNGMLTEGNILKPLEINVQYTQQGVTSRLVDNFIIDTTKGLQLNNTSFNNGFKPNEIKCQIRKKTGSDYFLTEIQGLTWGLLKEEGKVKSSDYSTVNTTVVPLYSFLDIVTILLAIYSLAVQIDKTIEAAEESVADLTQKFGDAATSPFGVSIVFSVAYSAVKALLVIGSAIVLLGLVVKLVLDMILLLYPPLLKNKGITLRRGMEIICERLGYQFVAKLPILDQVVYMPSGAHSEGRNLIKNNLPNWFANDRGVPNDYDYGYICVDFVELVKQVVNGRIDVMDSPNGLPIVKLRNENDPELFIKGDYLHRIRPNFTNIEYNLPDIPHTRLISFLIDDSDLYTTEYQEGRLWEVKNISNTGNLPFTKGEYIELNVSQGHRKTKLSIVEKTLLELAGVADSLAGLLGKDTKIKQSMKKGRTGVVVVSQNNFSKPKLVVVSGGKMPSNYKSILSAETIEKNYYVNRSIVRGTGQKILLRGVEVPMSLADREKIKNNGNFEDEYWGLCTFKSVEYQFSKDTAICNITVDNNYIAKNTFTERSYNGL